MTSLQEDIKQFKRAVENSSALVACSLLTQVMEGGVAINDMPVNYQCVKGWTAAHSAVVADDDTVMKWLLKSNIIDPWRVTDDGTMVFDMPGSRAMAELLCDWRLWYEGKDKDDHVYPAEEKPPVIIDISNITRGFCR